ncbi:pyridoxamine 5'-phosphate oxidase family protein [Rhodoblastus sp.]|uniref:pyridoxamine 5'-phosphate oxidase family protein n=1 Tax=Rhodoblastus sp. TaxID=1962975 RepID=UPI003F9AE616
MSETLPDPRRSWRQGEILARRLADKPEIPAVIRTAMSARLREFFAALPLVFVAGVDAQCAPAASILHGAPGFIACPAPDLLEMAADFPAGDPLRENFREGAPFGLIGIDFAARRRNRANGRILRAEPGKISLVVAEAFGNCPKYISPQENFPSAGPGSWTPLREIDDDAKAMISRANVFFIATRGPDGVDISHRGGPPGFVTMTPDRALIVPDYPGNNYFNTFGNLLHDPAAALLFPDFAHATALHLSGQARVTFAGEQRFWTFTPQTARLLRAK